MSAAESSRPEGSSAVRDSFQRGAVLAFFGYLFFLAIDLIGQGMKASFTAPLSAYLNSEASGFDELASFATGILGTALVQSSSSVTSMAVVLTQEGAVPLVIAVGIAHGANLGTSVTSTIVAFAAEFRAIPGNPLKALKTLLWDPRPPGFRRAAGTAVVHDMFNIVMVTTTLLVIELPFGLVRRAAEASAGVLAGFAGAGGETLSLLGWLAPKTYTKPISGALLHHGVPGWLVATIGLPLLFMALRGFSTRMRDEVLRGVDPNDVSAIGRRLLGDSPAGTFWRGLVLTILVQSSSATTSMVVPLAAMGFFRVRQVFPFIMGANIGTTTTALLAALGGVGGAGFHAGLTIALGHLFLNSFAVLFVWFVPGVATSILGAAQWLAWKASKRPIVLVLYVFSLAVIAPIGVFVLPEWLSVGLLSTLMVVMIVGPHIYLSRRSLGRPASIFQRRRRYTELPIESPRGGNGFGSERALKL